MLSIEDKIRLVTGDGTWWTDDLDGRVDRIFMTDGPHGLRVEKQDQGYMGKSDVATAYPTASALACSWNPLIAKALGQALAGEALQHEIDILLGPGLNMKRLPNCGRNFEYLSEDPLLAGVLASAYIEGMERMGVGSCPKHFAVNNQETRRNTSNSMVDERAYREIYLQAFERLVKDQQPISIMASYNAINGRYACENKELLRNILRDEWGYEGLTISDWGACVNLPESLEAGMDLEMPDSLGIHAKDLKRAIEEDRFDVSKLDEAAGRVLAVKEKIAAKKVEGLEVLDPAATAQWMAEESIILLKNDGILPLVAREIVVVGDMARPMRFQGGGSSFVETGRKPDGVKALEKTGFRVHFARGYDSRGHAVDVAFEEEALALAKKGLPIFFFGGLSPVAEGEGYDRKDLNMPANQAALLAKLVDQSDQVILISMSGSPYVIPEIDRLGAILQVYLAGEYVDKAVARVVTGQVNPGGRLAETWPTTIEATPAHAYFDPDSHDLQYRESILIGYRYYNSLNVPVLFPFGYGLSYSDFVMKDLQLLESEADGYAASVTVEHGGGPVGAALVQLYVENPDLGFLREKRKLVGWQKVFLEPGESKQIEIPLDERAFSIYHPVSKDWVEPAGVYQVQAAWSVEEVVLSEEFEIEGVDATRLDGLASADYFGPDKQVTEDKFARLYAKDFANFDGAKPGTFTRRHSLDTMRSHSRMARFLHWLIPKALHWMIRDAGPDDPQLKMMVEGALTGPIDIIVVQGGGHLPNRVANATVDFANKRLGRGLKRLLTGR